MDQRIIKDIRYYERKPIDFKGSFDGSFGNVYCSTNDTKYIGQRIARKLHEYGFTAGKYDHIYIQFSSDLGDDEISESEVFNDKRIRTFIYGLNPSNFNRLSIDDRDKKIKEITFKVFRWVFSSDDSKIQMINDVVTLIEKFDRSLTIRYKTKEARLYRINLSFQIRPIDEKSKLIVEYTDKQDDNILYDVIELLDYEDLYLLIDSATLKDGFIQFQPKKNYLVEMISRQYKNQLKSIEINKMKKNNCH